jgi:hypothetical protein
MDQAIRRLPAMRRRPCRGADKENQVTSTEMVETPEARQHDYEIFVNTRPHRVESDIVSYTEVVDIAFPGHPVNPNIYFEVTYKGAAGPKHDGSLLDGESVKVKDGTRLHVTQTDRS